MRTIYLSHSTTAPLDPRVRDLMLPLLEEDPSLGDGLLGDGRRIRDVIGRARGQVAALCGATPGEIVFGSGGTEACNLALKGAVLGSGRRTGEILVGATEHTAVLYPARTLSRLGFVIRTIPVDGSGVVDLEALAGMMTGDTLLVSVPVSDPETGTIQPVAEVVRLARAHGALTHTDACLAAACLPVDVVALGVDLASFSAHKIHGPRGCGALYVRDGVRLTPLIEGGVNEGGRRGGAEYVAGIAGFGAAATGTRRDLAEVGPRLAALTRALHEGIAGLEGVRLNGHPERRLPGMLNVSVEGIDGEALLLKLARAGIVATSGSACIRETGKPSHVLTAMGHAPERARGSVLFSLGRGTTAGDVARVIEAFAGAVAFLRSVAGRVPDA